MSSKEGSEMMTKRGTHRTGRARDGVCKVVGHNYTLLCDWRETAVANLFLECGWFLVVFVCVWAVMLLTLWLTSAVDQVVHAG